MSFNNFLKKIDGVLHGKYSMEKFKSGFTGKNFPAEEPKFEFEKPVFEKKIDLPLCSEVTSARTYLESRALDPTLFYYAEKFNQFVNTLKVTFDSFSQDEPRIVIPLSLIHI